jgi:hypothetical protein
VSASHQSFDQLHGMEFIPLADVMSSCVVQLFDLCAEIVCGATATTMTKCDGRTNVPAMCFVGIAGPEIPNISRVTVLQHVSISSTVSCGYVALTLNNESKHYAESLYYELAPIL